MGGSGTSHPVLRMTILMIAATMVAAVAPVAPVGAHPASGPSTCSLSDVTAALSEMEPPDYAATALNLATRSSAYQEQASNLSPPQHLQPNSVYQGFSENRTDCSPIILSINAVFSINGSSPPKNYVVVENPQMTKVMSTRTEPVLPGTNPPARSSQILGQAPAASNDACSYSTKYACWNGWEVHSSASQVLMEWNVPHMTGAGPPAGCGTYWENKVCALYVWVGQTIDSGGTAPDGSTSGISQAGTSDVQRASIFGGGGYTLSYKDWYEFFPANMVTCHSISSGDSMGALSWYDGYYYHTVVYDGGSTNYGCASAQSPSNFPMNGRSPVYEQFMAEQPNNHRSAKEPVPPVNNFWLNAQDYSNHYFPTYCPTHCIPWNNIDAIQKTGWYDSSNSNCIDGLDGCFEEVWQG